MSENTSTNQLPKLLEAIGAMGSNLTLAAVLERIVEVACELIDAEYGALGVLDETGMGLSEFIHIGIDKETAEKIGPLPHGKGILGRLINHPEPLRLPHLKAHPDSYGFPEHHPGMDSFLGVPIRVRDEIFGNLYLTNKRSAQEFSEDDEQFAIALAVAAGTFIENSRLHERVQNTAIIEDRERIARDLHDLVIQRLFAAGLSIQSLANSVPPESRARLDSVVGELDDTVRQIRTTIFSLETPTELGDSVRSRALAVIARGTEGASVEPAIQFIGPVDSVVGEEVAENLLAVLEEALSNLVRHANATSAEIRICVDKQNTFVTLEIEDDGIGFDDKNPLGNGIRNMAGRADALGGAFSCEAKAKGGTLLTWSAKLVST